MNRKEKLKEILRRGWGLLPLAFVLLCVALVAAIQAVTGGTLRSVPRMVLVCMGVCSFGVALLWANIRLIFADIPLRVLSVLLKFATPVLSFVLFCYIVLGTVVFVAFSYCPEHVVMYRGTKAVASVNSFVDIWVDYYEYKNPLFYGRHLAEEWHGSGGYDPFEDEETPTPKSWTIYDEQGKPVERGP